MKSVGIKALKNRLSSYLKFVKNGEVVLVTDRDEVVAEIRRPTSLHSLSATSRLDAFLEDAISRGSITRPQGSSSFPASRADLLKPPVDVDPALLLADAREEKYE